MVNKDSIKIYELGVEALKEKKAENISVIDISDFSSVADVMVVASGNNINQIQAMADEVGQALGKGGYKHMSVEGYDKANWILLDYNDVIFHLFDKENRNFYDLERLYRDGRFIEL